jgi:hypothetical protein
MQFIIISFHINKSRAYADLIMTNYYDETRIFLLQVSVVLELLFLAV